VRTGTLVVLSLFLLTLFAAKCYCIDWDNPYDRTADQMFSEDTYTQGPSLTQLAQAERAKDIGQPGMGALSAPPGNNTAASQETAGEEQNQEAMAQPEVSSSSEQKTVSGSWTILLNDSASRTSVLTLFQNQDAVYGMGNLKTDANTTLIAAASGSVSGDELDLDIVSLGMVSLYRISMTIDGDTATGSYTAFSPNEASTTGTAEGTRSLPSA
jgi:hypothetical protein